MRQTNTWIKATARRIADAYFYVEPAMHGADGFNVRSMINGARLAFAATEAAANRRALRLAVCKMRLSKQWPGTAKELQALLCA